MAMAIMIMATAMMAMAREMSEVMMMFLVMIEGMSVGRLQVNTTHLSDHIDFDDSNGDDDV